MNIKGTVSKTNQNEPLKKKFEYIISSGKTPWLKADYGWLWLNFSIDVLENSY